jgi:uridylate kinase
VHKRVLLKLSGEALGRMPDGSGIDPSTLDGLCEELAEVHALGVQLGLVVGGGNIFRGLKGSAAGMDRSSADYMGMLATVINGIALLDRLEKHSIPSRLMTALEIRHVAESFVRRRAIRHFDKGRVVIFVAGTGNPFFSTDTAAALRAAQIQADILCKATKVPGVYDRDPEKYPNARLFDHLSYDRFLQEHIGVMDATAVALCRDNRVPIRVFSVIKRGNIKKAVCGEPLGTLIDDLDDEKGVPEGSVSDRKKPKLPARGATPARKVAVKRSEGK